MIGEPSGCYTIIVHHFIVWRFSMCSKRVVYPFQLTWYQSYLFPRYKQLSPYHLSQIPVILLEWSHIHISFLVNDMADFTTPFSS